MAGLVAAIVLLVAGAYVAFGLTTAGWTLGCDYVSYHGAATRFLAGQPIYDPFAAWNTECRLYQYPPTGILLALPFTLLGYDVGMWAWIGMNIAAFVLAAAIMPVGRSVRWAVLLLGAVSWPFIFGVRIGQVTPLMLLLFAAGWRALDRPRVLGALVGIGTMLKLQPALLFGWLVLRREWRAVVAGLITIAVIASVAAAIGLSDWVAFANHVRKIGNGLSQPTNAAIGAIVHGRGASLGVAAAVQVANTLAVLGLVALAALRCRRETGYVVAVVASQLASPIVWDHYALLLLIPVAWLLERRQWWAVAVPIAHAWVLFPFMPFLAYPIAMYAMLLAPFAVDRTWLPSRGDRRGHATQSQLAG
jgi:hypothetical protein